MIEMKPIWHRKIRRLPTGELVVSIPKEFEKSFKNIEKVCLTLENGKLVITPEVESDAN